MLRVAVKGIESFKLVLQEKRHEVEEEIVAR